MGRSTWARRVLETLTLQTWHMHHLTHRIWPEQGSRGLCPVPKAK